MKNQVKQDGRNKRFTAAAPVLSGGVVVVGTLVGVAVDDVANGAEGVLNLVGDYSLKKKAATAFVDGQLAYWDIGNAEVTDLPNAGANPLMGTAEGIADAGDANLDVRLSGVAAV